MTTLKRWFNRRFPGYVRCSHSWCWRAREWDSRCDRHSRYSAQQRIRALHAAARQRVAGLPAQEPDLDEDGADRDAMAMQREVLADA